MWSSDSGQKVIIDDKIHGTMWYVDKYGDHHDVSQEEYQVLKTEDNVTVIRLEYAKHWHN